jgi:hypothetical protein
MLDQPTRRAAALRFLGLDALAAQVTQVNTLAPVQTDAVLDALVQRLEVLEAQAVRPASASTVRAPASRRERPARTGRRVWMAMPTGVLMD